MRKAAVVFSCLILAAAVIAAGLKIKQEKQYRTMVDVYADILLPIAADAERYYDALDLAEAYVLGETDIRNLLEGLEKTGKELRAVRDGLADSGEEAARLLEKSGFDQKSAQSMAERRAAGLEEYIWSLESLRDYFREQKNTDFSGSDKMSWSRTIDTIKGTSRGLRYYGDINYWFARENGKRTEYVLEKIVRRLPASATEPFAWEEDPLMIDRKLEICTEYRKSYYEIGYPVSSCAALEEIRGRYEREAALRGFSVYAGSSWMNALTELRNTAEASAYLEDALERKERYGDLYFDEVLEES